LGNISEYLEDREIDLNIQEIEPIEKVKWLGSTIKETWDLYSFTVVRIFGFFAYYVVGVVFYNYFEGWNRLDSVYFITQTVSTVGYGTQDPTTDLSKIFTVFYIFTGILLIFTVVGDLTRHFFVETIRRGYKKKIVRTKLAIVVRNIVNAAMWIAIIFGIVIFGALVFSNNEKDLTFVDAFYFAAYTSTSVGYGNKVYKPSTIYFNIAYMLISVALTAIGFEKIANVKRHIDEHETDQQLNKIELSDRLLLAIYKPDISTLKDKVSCSEYVLHMLLLAGKIDINMDIKPWINKFNDFDLDHDKYLTKNDVLLYQRIDQKMKKQVKQMKKNRPNQLQKKRIFRRVLEELRDIFLETIKVKKSDEKFDSVVFFSSHNDLNNNVSNELDTRPSEVCGRPSDFIYTDIFSDDEESKNRATADMVVHTPNMQRSRIPSSPSSSSTTISSTSPRHRSLSPNQQLLENTKPNTYRQNGIAKLNQNLLTEVSSTQSSISMWENSPKTSKLSIRPASPTKSRLDGYAISTQKKSTHLDNPNERNRSRKL